MADLVNLRRFKKAKARQDKAEAGQRNRVKYGRTAAEKIRAEIERNREAAFLDGVRQEPPHDTDD
ncbi:MAG: DUF4169 family protein [Rhodospirillaceae bacterium]|jgi:hypothetical protein|nr:DUF4169 family protein [Rhodospirillaceae bacterium]MBT5667134.1 DUF4169 family protein [Rhodospirillaceae bacterium]